MSKPRNASVFPRQIQVLHVFCRLVRRAFLMGVDSLTGINYDHRRDWLRERMILLARVYCIDVVTIAIMHNHFHIQVRTRPDLVDKLTDEQVVRRLLLLESTRYFFPDGSERKPFQRELKRRLNDPERIKQDRERLSNISKFMQSLNQHLAIKANRESNEAGTFFEKRFGHELLEDEQAILANALYIDSNPIRAEIANTPEESEFTGAYERIQDLRQQLTLGSSTETPEECDSNHQKTDSNDSTETNQEDGLNETKSESNHAFEFGPGQLNSSDVHAWERNGMRESGFMCPIEIDELKDPLGPDIDPSGQRPSRKGILAMSLLDYLTLLDATARQLRKGKRGAIPNRLTTILNRLELKFDGLVQTVREKFASKDRYFLATERHGRPDEKFDSKDPVKRELRNADANANKLQLAPNSP